MSSACTQVLSTPELLESILTHLPPSTLLSTHLVSRHFHHTITSSPTLQQALFFRPAASPEWSLNSLLRKHFLPFFVAPGTRWTKGSARTFGCLQILPWAKSALTKEAFLRKEASWRRMLVMHPSPTDLHVISWVHAMGGDTESKCKISFENGVTMGAVYDIAESFLRRHFASHGSFGLSFLDRGPDEPPYLALRMSWSISCTGGWARNNDALRSEAAELEFEKLEWEPKPEGWTRGYRNSSYESDLSAERGGVEGEEWESWVGCYGPVEEPDDTPPVLVRTKRANGSVAIEFK
jgi:hypothetical protein